MAAVTQRTVTTPDGRTLAIEEGGDPAGRPVLVHNGTPNSRHLFAPVAGDAAARGLRLIGYDRPGYGGSTAQPGRTVADCAADARAICAELGITRLAMWGISGGGPHLLACAALLPDLVVAAASLAALAPSDAAGLDWFEGMGQDNVDDFKLGQSDKVAARAKLETEREETMAASGEDLAGLLKTLLTPADAAVLTGEFAEYLAWTGREGLAPGAQGWWDDGEAFGRDWGFELSAIEVPVLLMHGREDQFVPFGHGQWLAGRIPGVEARLLDDDGHLTLITNRIGEVHAWLAERL
ncbi:MAG TPA: alpha/beta fold hydrolase [Streptosporangiaceae bacterium]|jgi:pimeloyl-ACP methyl ester carboxylesterase